MRIAVFGLGKLGAPVAALLGAKGHQVVGVDIDQRQTDALNIGVWDSPEPQLGHLIKRYTHNLSATRDGNYAALWADVVFVVVPTPSQDDGSFSPEFLQNACRLIGEAIGQGGARKLVVITSTTSPGTMDSRIATLLDSCANGHDYDLCYSPEFIALGAVLQNLQNPNFILIGESSTEAGERLEQLRFSLCENLPSVCRMNFVNAEITKLAVNTFVTTKISYANMIGEMCEQIPGADANVVTHAIGLDSRIGSKYLKPATAYGGPCFPRDNRALVAAAVKVGVGADIAEATDAINARQITRLARKVRGNVAILGLAYKPDTALSEKSAGVLLANELSPSGILVCVYDPVAMDDAKERLHKTSTLSFADSIEECLEGAETVVVATPWPEFRDLRSRLPASCTTLIDCWDIVDTEGQ